MDAICFVCWTCILQITSFMAHKLDCPPTQPFPCVMLAFATMLCSCPRQLGEIHLHPGTWPTMAYNPSCVGGLTTQSPSDLGWVGTRSMKHDLDLNPKMATYLHVPPCHPETCYVSNLLLRTCMFFSTSFMTCKLNCPPTQPFPCVSFVSQAIG